MNSLFASRLVFSLLLPSAALASCDDPDSLPADDAAACAAISAEYDSIVATVGASCETVADCALAGGAGRWCEAYPSLGSFTGGRPVNALAYASHARSGRLAELTTIFEARCAGRRDLCVGSASAGGLGCVSDAGPNALACVDRVCVASLQSCNVPDLGTSADDAAIP